VGTVPVLPARLAFDDVRLPGLHRAGFAARHSDEARADPGLCTTCHTAPSRVADHERRGPRLAGAHGSRVVCWLPRGCRRAALHRVPPRRRSGWQSARARLR
jgi:hypothetical protein